MPEPPTPRPAAFPTTRWSRVAAAVNPVDPEARAALTTLCSAYWYPIYALIRRRGHEAHAALDLTQAYFARLLENGTLAAADRSRGRFRAFLRTDCGHFLADQADRDHAIKRGGDRTIVSIDALHAEGRYRDEPADDRNTPERLFDRAWALTLLDSVVTRVADDYRQSGRGPLFDCLRPTLTEGPRAVPLDQAAATLGITQAAVQKAAQRLRAHYRDQLRHSIAATLDTPSEAAVDDEIRDLFNALGG